MLRKKFNNEDLKRSRRKKGSTSASEPVQGGDDEAVASIPVQATEPQAQPPAEVPCSITG